MKTNKTNLIKKMGSFIYLPMLVLAFLILYSFSLQSSESKNKMEVKQQEKITLIGKVLDTESNVLDGVLVKDKNSDIKTETDGDGKFTLVLYEPTVVHFIKLGFQAQEMKITESDSNLVVIMTPESNEMIVKGFDIESKATQDAQRKLDSLSSLIDNFPLYIIDEEQKERDFDIKMIDAEEILSIEILKDSIAKGLTNSKGDRSTVKIITKNHMKMNNQNQMMNNQNQMKMNQNQMGNENSMHMNKSDTASVSSKEKYKMNMDTMNVRNKKWNDQKMKNPKDKSIYKGTLEKKENKNLELKKDTIKTLQKNKEEMK